MTEEHLNLQNQEYDEYMVSKYESKIQNGFLQVGSSDNGDPEIINLNFLEKLNIQTLKLYNNNAMYVQMESNTIKELNLKLPSHLQELLKLNVDDLELENLEVLVLDANRLQNNQLNNLAKFKKLHTLDLSYNNVNLIHIQSVVSLTKLFIKCCGLKNIEQITSLVNLKELNLSLNPDIDIAPLCKVNSLTKLNISECQLKQIDQIGNITNLQVLNASKNLLGNTDNIGLLVNLKELNISYNNNIDITALKDLVGLIKLQLQCCGFQKVSTLKSLINLQNLDLSYNYNLNITELQYLKNLTDLNLLSCNLVSICVLKPLVKLESLIIEDNKIVYLDANLNEMKQLKVLRVDVNRISDFTQFQKHNNYKKIYENEHKCIDISYQYQPSENELFQANKMRHIERPNNQLIEISNKRQTFITALNNFIHEIVAVTNNAHQNHIKLTSSVVCFIQQLDQFVFD
ncbi:tandem-95_repeat protein [Hexamita inflata]|uniref:Tandem-95 repeat protein n=1 Tax=Hexamita inflata TaxID=28002 RepID=A0AA86PC70_9EUKA|nr:tandem-95 repeat protein [Hexamita inflata]